MREPAIIMKAHRIYFDAYGPTDAKYLLSLEGHRLLLYLSTLIRGDDERGREYIIVIPEYCRFMGMRSSSYYAKIREVCAGLANQPVEITSLDYQTVWETRWLASYRDYPQQGRVGVSLAPAVRDYVLQLKLMADLPAGLPDGMEGLKKFRSAYAFRFYEILKTTLLRGSQTLVLTVGNLRWLLAMDTQYAGTYASFKKHAIIAAQTELAAKSDIRFEFTESKDGRRIDTINFFLSWKRVEAREAQMAAQMAVQMAAHRAAKNSAPR